MTQQGPIIFNGRYELHRRLGRGGMAEVYLARDQMLDRPVAVKVLFPALATDPGFVERFRREAQSAAALNHPNIVGVYDWGEANGTYFIVMEYVEGESLAELIHAEGRVHPDRAAEMAADIASALDFAHRNGGVIHRDVKPGNVLITKDGDVKVADFGIARAISDSSDTNLTKTGSVMGTATYFSPEQARGAAIDPRSDVYSLGCVIYEMIIGQPPFAGENAVAIAYKHVQEPPPSPRSLDPAIPDTLEAIIMKCLAKNVDNRYPSAQDLRADLRRYLDGARIMAEPVMAGMADPGATGLMAPTGYMQPTSAMSPYDDPYGDPYDDGYGDEDEEEEKKSKAPLIVLILLLLLLAGLLLWWALSSSGGGDSEVEVPSDLIGMNIEDASEELEEVGLEVDRDPVSEPDDLQSRFSVSPDDTDDGEVVAQDPGAGEVLTEGDKVTLSYWAGDIELIAIPDLAGTDRYDAQDALRELGFTNVKEEFEKSEEYEQDQVTRTDPAANTEAEPDTEITLWVSEGEEQVTVPDVVGLNLTDAETALTDAGLTVGNVTEEFSDTVPDGSVISQSATGEVNAGTTVNLVVSMGAEVTEVQVPDVLGRQQAAAETMITNAGLVPNVTTVPTDNPDEDNKVIQQDPTSGNTLPEGGTVTITVGEYTEPDDPPDTTQPPDPTIPIPGDD